MRSVVYAIANQKGGCGKTTLSLNLAVALARMNKKILLIDLDSQANATMALGYQSPDELPLTVATIFKEVIENQMKPERSALIQGRDYICHAQDIDFVPSCIELAAVENVLINTISRENVLKRFISFIKDRYDIVIINTMPSLSFVTINALTAADKVLIPV